LVNVNLFHYLFSQIIVGGGCNQIIDGIIFISSGKCPHLFTSSLPENVTLAYRKQHEKNPVITVRILS